MGGVMKVTIQYPSDDAESKFKPNPEHVSILKQGVDVWNRWRVNHPHVRPDLRHAGLREAVLLGEDVQPQLSHVNFREAILFGADLSGADLSRAELIDSDLRGALFGGAILREANLHRALLTDADLRSTDLSGALLTETNLRRANLCAADLSGADLSGATLSRAVLDEANLTRATLRRAHLYGASLTRADLHSAVLIEANLGEANLSEANLTDTRLRGALLREANLSGANLTGTDLRYSRLVDVNLEKASISDCALYGISAWNLKLSGTNQSNLIITRPDEPTITVDNIEVAQFIYMLLNNQKVRDVVNTITSKAVLILGRFTTERKIILDALREELRSRDYLPILFDFDKPSSRNLTETVSILAHLSRFIIADITDAKSIPQELQRVIPDLPSLPVQPLILSSEYEYGMFVDFLNYPWVLAPYRYDSLEDLLSSLEERVIAPAAARAAEAEERRKAIEREMAR
jgi:uncharacterized protein YjbI with pentapeptide repeats